MQHLLTLLTSCGIDFDANERRIICLPHLLNTCARHVTENYKAVDFLDIGVDAWVDSLGDIINRDTYIMELKRDPIKLARNIVRCLRASNGRRLAFQATIRNGNEMCCWIDADGEHTDIAE